MRADDEQPAAQQLLAQELKERQGRRVGPMQVVEHQRNGHLQRGLVEELPYGVKRAESRSARIRYGTGRLFGMLRRIQEFRHKGGDISRRRAHVETYLVERRGVYIGSKDLHPRPVRRRPHFLMATPPKHEGALILGHLREGLRTARLSDSGLTGYQYQLTSARKHPVERRPKYIKFARPPDYGPALFPAIGCQIVHAALILA